MSWLIPICIVILIVKRVVQRFSPTSKVMKPPVEEKSGDD